MISNGHENDVMKADNEPSSIETLLEIMRALRDPDTGCPWDQVQNFSTIAPYTIEEAYEVADAINRREMGDLCDELGDLLLQVVYHAQMAEEQGYFGFTQVLKAICEKMIRRHPHVFGNQEELKAGKKDWEYMKSLERQEKGEIEDLSALAHIAHGLPPLVRARKLQKKAAKVGFDWPSIDGVVAKLQEEVIELNQAVELNNIDSIEDEMGDVLFSVVNLCRHANVDAEIALQKANHKFEARFRCVEKLASQQNKKLSELEEKQLDELWNQAKARLS